MSQRNLSKIARAESVAQLSSTEQLDQRLIVIRSGSWILLLVAMLVIGVLVAWGFFGRLPNSVQGEGIIVPRGTEPIRINSPTGMGGVVDIVVDPGTSVEVGDTLVTLANHELETKVANAKSQLAVLESQDERMTKAEQEILDRQKAALDVQLASCKETTEQTKKLSTLYSAELEEIKDLVAKQLVPRTQLVQTQQQYFSVLQQIAQQETIVAKANEGYFSLVTSTERERLGRASGLEQAREALEAVKMDLKVSTSVLAPVAGTVLLHEVDMGSTVTVGSHVTSIRPNGVADAALTAKIYVSYGLGRRIRPGMKAWLTLPFVKPSRYGYIEGVVQSVSDFVSGGSASTSLGSESLAEGVTRKLGATLEVIVTIKRDDSNPTGMLWTSGRGYDQPVEFPALCGAKIIVSQDRPIDLVLPWLKDLLGIDPQVQVLTDTAG